MSVSRRTFFGGLIALLAAAPVTAGAEPDDAERRALIEHLREKLVGFDVLAFARRGLEQLGLGRWIPDVEALLADREHLRGLRSIHELGKDEAFQAKADELMTRMSGHLGTKLAIRRLAKRAPQTAEAQRALIDTVITDWLGIDLERLRAHTATLPEGMLVVVGPPTDLAETLASAGREPFVRYVELIHGYRAREWVTFVDERKALLEALVDPAIRVVAFTGHGSWTGFSMSGIVGPPMETLGAVCRNVKKDPKKYVPSVLANNVWRSAGARHQQGMLEEAELAALVKQLHPGSDGRLPEPKERVVRYTCGVGRYRTDAGLLWEMLPEALSEQVHRYGTALSARWPEDEGHWEEALEAWLVGRSVTLEDQPALGTCLVASVEDTRGYAGNSWLPDFVEDPIPAYQAPHAWRVGAEPVVQADAP